MDESRSADQQPPVTAVLRDLLEPLPAPGTDGHLIARAARFRRFSAELLAVDADAPAADVDRSIATLRARRLGAVDTHPETGASDFVWSSDAWAWITEQWAGAPEPDELLETGHLVAASGRRSEQLFYLLAAGDFRTADQIAGRELRRLLLFTEPTTVDLLLASDRLKYHDCPNLMLLAAQMRIRRQSTYPEYVRDSRRAMGLLRDERGLEPVEQVSASARMAFAAASCGARAEAAENLNQVLELTRSDDGFDGQDWGAPDQAQRDELAGSFFLAFWSAIQLDDHETGLVLARRIHQVGAADDPVMRFDAVTLRTQLDFAGLRSLSMDGQRPSTDELSHGLPFLSLEDGNAAEAVAYLQPISTRIAAHPSRSAADALLLLVDTMSARQELTAADIDFLMTRSREFWDDRQPGSFLTFAAVLSYLGLGEHTAALDAAAALEADDWFAWATRAVIDLASGRPDSALEHLSRATSDLPRLDAVTGVLSVTADLDAGNVEAAVSRLHPQWERAPYPRLLRFALRLMPRASLRRLQRAATGLDPELAATLEAAASDTRLLALAYPATALTRSERETLDLLADGLSNAQIADHRMVSMNTLRSQLRPLYKKLRVLDRADAIELWTRLQLTDDGTWRTR